MPGPGRHRGGRAAGGVLHYRAGRGVPAWLEVLGGGPLALEHGVSDRRAFLELVFRVGTTSNGVFGVKMTWNYVPWALEKLRELPEYRELSQAEAFAALLPGLRLVQVVRRDRVRQADGLNDEWAERFERE